MVRRKLLGHITSAKFGIQGGHLGLFLTMSHEGLGEFRAGVAFDLDGDEALKIHYKLYYPDTSILNDTRALTMCRIGVLLRQANVTDIGSLVGTMVKMVVEGDKLESWEV